ncbi:MAG: hypothetical protein GY723_09135 [bacterium]|nr:hypothetical protein [bacterium]MCP5068316.1 hypothetical protein [bacterium]
MNASSPGGKLLPTVIQAVLLVISLLVGPVAAATAEAVTIPGTRVSIEPPPGFSLATKFPGVQDLDRASSIMISELPVPISGVTAGFTEEGLLASGMVFRSSEETDIGGRAGHLISATQVANGTTYEKWMAAFGSTSMTVLVVANFPQRHAPELRAPMRSSVLSVTWKPDAKPDLFGGLTFRIRESERLKIQNRVQNMLLLSDSGQIADSPVAVPFVVVGSSDSPARIEDLEAFAKQRITQTAQVSGVDGIRGEPRQIGARTAYEVIAQAKDQRSGEEVTLYQLIAVDGDTYYMIHAMVARSRFDDYLPEFRQVADSLEIH